jgi:hypothetical protein
MARKRSTSTDPAALDQAQAIQETKSGLSSDEGRKKSTDATRVAGPSSTRKQTSSRVKTSAAKPASVAGAASRAHESKLAGAGATGQGAPSAEVSAQEKIALLAYSYWEARGRQGGPKEEQEDWLRAEREVLSSLAANEQ